VSTSLLIALSVAEAVVVIVVLALALIEIRRRLERIAHGLETLAGALRTVESEHLRPLAPGVLAINRGFDRIIALMPGVADKAAIVAAHARERR
jgi:hypothetical protein